MTAPDTLASIDASLASDGDALARSLTPTVTTRARDMGKVLHDVRNNLITPSEALAAGLTPQVLADAPECAAMSLSGELRAGRVELTNDDGDVALAYSAEDGHPWHKLARANGGIVLDRRMGTAEAVLRAGQAFTITEGPLGELFGITGHRDVTDLRLLQRDDTGGALAVVGRQFQIWQREEIALLGAKILDASPLALLVSSCGSQEVAGRTFFISFVVPDALRIDPGGANDEIMQYLGLVDPTTGHHSVRADVSYYRRVCRNTDTFARTEALLSMQIPHKVGIKREIDAGEATQRAREVLTFLTHRREEYAADAQALYELRLSTDEARDVLRKVYDYPADPTADLTDRARRSQDARIDRILTETVENTTQANLIEAGGLTGWALLNGLSFYEDHAGRVKTPKGVAEDVWRTIRQVDPASESSARKQKTRDVLMLVRAGR